MRSLPCDLGALTGPPGRGLSATAVFSFEGCISLHLGARADPAACAPPASAASQGAQAFRSIVHQDLDELGQRDTAKALPRAEIQAIEHGSLCRATPLPALSALESVATLD